MAVIKSGQSSDQLTIEPISKAARVTLYNPDGSIAPLVSITIPAAVSATLAQETGNIQTVAQQTFVLAAILMAILTESRIQNDLLVQIALGQFNSPPDLDALRNDPQYGILPANVNVS